MSDLVLTGTVTHSKDIRDQDDPEGTTGTFYTVRVNHYLRGSAGLILHVYSENSTARFPMDFHGSYILFLTRDTERHWVVDNCGNSGIFSKSAKVIASLQRLPLKQSFIYGDVYRYADTPGAPCETMQLTIRASGFSKITEVNQNCTFHVDVPSGRYEATMRWNGTVLPANDLNYKDIYCFDVPPGGSAGLAFRYMDGADKKNLDANAKTDRGYKARCTSGQSLRGPIFIP